MTKCPKCESLNISVIYEAEGAERKYRRTIDGIKKFMRNDTYYHWDMIKKEHLIYTCDTCGYKVAEPTKDTI